MTLSAVASFTASCVITYAVHSIASWGARKILSFFFQKPNCSEDSSSNIVIPYGQLNWCRWNIG